MRLFLRQNCGAVLQSSSVIFHIFDESGNLCGQAVQLSGLLSEGFQLSGRLPQSELAVHIHSARLPAGKVYVISADARRRARLTLLREQLRIELDGLPCSLLGTPLTGEYTLADAHGQVLFSQQRCPGADGRNVFLLSVPDDARADVYLGIAVCLSRLLAHPSGKFSPVPAGL